MDEPTTRHVGMAAGADVEISGVDGEYLERPARDPTRGRPSERLTTACFSIMLKPLLDLAAELRGQAAVTLAAGAVDAAMPGGAGGAAAAGVTGASG